MNNPVPDDVQEFANTLFALARAHDGAQQLAAYIDHGVDVNLSNHEGNSLLMLAAYSGNVETVKQLLQRGADVNQLNDRGQSPLAGVIFKKETELISLLLRAGADPLLGHPSAVDTAAMFGVNLDEYGEK